MSRRSADPPPPYSIRPARTRDVRAILALSEPLVDQRVLVPKDAVAYYEDIQEFLIAEDGDGEVVGFGALHVMWEDLAEVRTLATSPTTRGSGLGAALLHQLLDRARSLGVTRVFCLTFETAFFARHGFEPLGEGQEAVDPEVYAELLRSPDEGVAEFLDLARVKPNTLGNTRMFLTL
ncbi:amino-acid N-acetyltransferase [Nesterenkonia sp. NBAIMH1]|uniref:amino-acid N-acetyltransferase n=1 Tax=Nesterenkonia sp. NBAIMH1 TaxID=2600320 RepID=UPI0011B5AD6E|nr:amino-acid N-acetyltransferase [Nesterenkonia sp. NBAIMH1]